MGIFKKSAINKLRKFGDVVVATHDGDFHADDVFSIALLQILCSEAGVKINTLRTRDEGMINVMDIRVDVGGRWDEKTLDFDHHQNDPKLMQPEGIKHAAIGLLCQWCMDPKFLQVFRLKYLLGLEHQDNTGKAHPDYPSIGFAIQPFLPVYGQNEDDEMDKLFKDAVDVARQILERALMTTAGILRCEAELAEQTEQSVADGKILFLKEKMPLVEELHPELCFTIVKVPNGYSFRSYNGHLVKESYRGLKGYTLSRTTGHNGLFIHPGGFTGTMETLEGAIHVCESSL